MSREPKGRDQCEAEERGTAARREERGHAVVDRAEAVQQKGEVAKIVISFFPHSTAIFRPGYFSSNVP